MRIDSLDIQAISPLNLSHNHKNDSTPDITAGLAAQALQEPQRAGYSHGIAVALACQAIIRNIHANDFTRSEQLARESLDWFGRTDNKSLNSLACYALGFSLFAQSRFDEAIHYFGQAREYA